jgi:hypothetical protein
MIIAFSGYGGSGKDTAAEIIKAIDSDCEIKKFAGKLKQVATIITGIKDFENKSGNFAVNGYSTIINKRKYLQMLGTDGIRTVFPDAWVDALFLDYQGYAYNLPKWLITDMRFENEYNRVKQLGGYVVRINRGKPANDHDSEILLDSHEFDYTINNTGTLQEFVKNVKEVYESICDRDQCN